MLPRGAQIMSVDDHVIEYPRGWLDLRTARHADVAHRVERKSDGTGKHATQPTGTTFNKDRLGRSAFGRRER